MPATPKATTVTNAMVAALQAIQTGNGYHTDLGNQVFKGRPAQYQGDTTTRPYVSVIQLSDGPASVPRKQNARLREYAVEVTLDAGANYHEDQDKLLWDLIKAFSWRTQSDILSGTAQTIELGDATLDGPDPGSDKAVIILPVAVTYVDNFN